VGCAVAWELGRVTAALLGLPLCLAWPADALVSWLRSSRGRENSIAVTLEAGQVWRRPISLLFSSFSDWIYKLSGHWLDLDEVNQI
jgi:hypothetical protein